MMELAELSYLSLSVVALVVGFFIGSVGIGGILLIPSLAVLAGLTAQQAAATALFSFGFTGLVGSWFYHRRRSLPWRASLWICAGAAACGFVGAKVAARSDSRIVSLTVAAIILIAGLYNIFSISTVPRKDHPGIQEKCRSLLTIGAFSGFASGFSGAGGPVFSVPMMLWMGYAPIAAVGASQLLQVVTAVSGSAANFQSDLIHLPIAVWVTLFEVMGIALGTHFAHRAKEAALRRLAGALCIFVGLYMAARFA